MSTVPIFLITCKYYCSPTMHQAFQQYLDKFVWKRVELAPGNGYPLSCNGGIQPRSQVEWCTIGPRYGASPYKTLWSTPPGPQTGLHMNRSEIWSNIKRELLGLEWVENTTIQLTPPPPPPERKRRVWGRECHGGLAPGWWRHRQIALFSPSTLENSVSKKHRFQIALSLCSS